MRRIAALRDLSDDHHQGLVLARTAKRAANGEGALSAEEAWDELLLKFEQELAVHFQIEEDFLTAPMIAVGESDVVDQLVEEHRALRSFVAPDSDRTIEALARFGLLLEQHIRFEERTFFEIAQERLDDDTLKRVLEACAKRHL
jgi:hemerythrin-like domain-containing protein